MQPADKLLNADFLRRVEAVEQGAGRFFRVRTQVFVLFFVVLYFMLFLFVDALDFSFTVVLCLCHVTSVGSVT